MGNPIVLKKKFHSPKRRKQGSFFTVRSVKPQLVALLIGIALIATLTTGWLIYESAAKELIDDAWRQSQTLLETARTAINRQSEQICSFSWQLSNNAKVVPLLYAREQTPENILNKRDLIDLLQGMKAFSNTLADIGLYLPVSGQVVTAESSYHMEDYFSRLSDGAFEALQQVRHAAAGTALCNYVGLYEIQRIISRDQVLLFVSDLPIGQRSALGFAFFHLKVDKLQALLPPSESGAILLTDSTGTPLLSNVENERFDAICRLTAGHSATKLNYEGQDYSVMQTETDINGLYCTSVIPYQNILAHADEMRRTAMVVMCVCLLICMAASLWATKKLYAPIASTMSRLEQLGHSLPWRADQNEFVLLGDALRMISDQNRELTLSNRQFKRILKNRLLGDFIEGRLQDAQKAILQEAGISLPYSSAQVAVIDMDAHGARRVSEGLHTDIADWVEHQQGKGNYGALEVWCSQREDGKLLVLFNIEVGHPHPESLYDYLGQCFHMFSAYAPVRICVGRAYNLSDASSSLIDAMIALCGKMPAGKEGVLPAEDVSIPPDTEYSLAMEQQLTNYAMSLQTDKVNTLLDELCKAGTDENASTPVLRENLVQALLFTARRTARQAGVEAIFLQSIERENLQTGDLPLSASLLERIRRVFTSVIQAVGQSRTNQDEHLYQKLYNYIETHYTSDISLDTASAALGLSPSYIGLIFRRVGETSFARAVTETRVSRAKELLKTTDLTVYEIGRRVGVDNQNTFIRIFKKLEGVTPGQYRIAKLSIHEQN
ncbi:MAG: helix-turn-helix domain-containing protein [Eubacteriales bacterium]|nr:helix-turn-helix domain-containing protein [Eubacteriales bacterium]